MLKALLATTQLVGLFAQPVLQPLPAPAAPTGLHFVSPEQLRSIPLAELPFGGFTMPEAVDLSPHMPPPGHQNEQNSCVAWVSAYAVKTYQEKIEQRYQLVSRGQPDWGKIFSPAFVYNQINQGRDGGATLVDALNLLSSRGAVSWSEMPYNPDNYTLQPTSNQLQQARRYRISYWRRVNVQDPQEVKAQIQAGYPVMVGLLADEGLYRLKGNQVWKRRKGKLLGGHAVVIVGYDDRREAFKLMNSWGRRWADRGYGWVDYGFFRKMVREGYVAKDALNETLLDLVNQPQPAPPVERFSEHSPMPEIPEKEKKDKQQDNAVEEEQNLIDELDDLPPPAAGAEAPRAKPEGRSTATSSDTDARRRAQPLADPPLYVQSEEVTAPIFQLQKIEQARLKLNFSGWARLNPEQGRRARVLVKLYRDAEGQKPLFLPESNYRLPNQQGIALGEEVQVTRQFHWEASIPLDQLPTTTRALWAQPVLYLDDFGVEKGPLQRVEIKRF